jgi:calcium and integrin-binding protein 1
VYKKFEELTAKKPGDSALKKFLTIEEFVNIKELQHNPLRFRIASVFAINGKVSFDEYIDFLSVLSEEATRDVKTFYAFKIYDWDDDGYLTEGDVRKTVECLVGNELSKAEIDIAVRQVFEEADLSGDKQLSFVEFDHVVSRANDFENTFRILI